MTNERKVDLLFFFILWTAGLWILELDFRKSLGFVCLFCAWELNMGRMSKWKN